MSKSSSREARKVLGLVLTVGASIWLVSAIAVGLNTDVSQGVWALAFLFVAIGAWSFFATSQNVLSGLGAVLVSIGSVVLTALFLRDLIVPPTAPSGGITPEAISAAVIGAGAVLIGASMAASEKGSTILGGILALAGLAWGAAALIDYGGSFEQWVSSLPALVFLGVGMLAMRPSLLGSVVRRIRVLSGPSGVSPLSGSTD